MSEMQFGSLPGKRCLSAALKKILSHDHIHIFKETAAYIENDAVGCYNRLVSNLILTVLQKLGLPDTVSKCLRKLWDEVIHLIKTLWNIKCNL
jgi:hypothetical protein